jgi:hypothetical protein
MPSSDHLSEEEATRLWRRAAELQAEAARLREAAALGPGEPDEDPSSEGGYALTHVRAAAIEAGIGEEYVDAALADIRAERDVAAGVGRRSISRAILGDPPDTLACRRRIRAGAADVLRAMEAVLPKEPYGLALIDRSGDPLAGGSLVFDIPGASVTAGAQPGLVGDASWADMRQVYVQVQAAPDQEGASDVTLRAPVAWAWRINAGVATGIGALGLGFGSLAGTAVATAITAATGGAGLGAIAAALAVGIGGAGGGAGGVALTRVLHRSALRRGERSLRNMLSAVAAEAEGGWGIAP